MTSLPSETVSLNRNDVKFLLVCVVLLVAASAIGIAGFPKAFPEASIDFRVTREEAVAIGARELAARGLDVGGFTALAVFDHDDEAKVFLERTLGLAKANAAVGTAVPVWRWSIRWVKPLSKLELRAFVTPEGKLLSFRRSLPEKDAAADPGPEAARRMAEEALRSMRGIEAATLKVVEASEERKPARVDRRFVWESTSVRFGDAAVRYLVEVQGDRVGRSSTWLEVPERWREEYKTLRSKNQAAGTVATFGLFLTGVAVLAVFLERVRRRDVRWRWAAAFGLAGAGLQLASSLNELPIALFDYETTEGWGSFLAQAGLSAFGGAILLGLLLFLLVAAGEPLYREAYGDKPALGLVFSRRGLRTKRFLRGLVLGYALTALFFAYQVVFYLGADRLGAWAPADIPYSNLLGTRFPWLAVLLMGFMPATTEEFSSRMFSIPFLSRFSPRWVAVVVPAFIWGFAHSAYPNQPFWIRGVEVGLAGVVIGALMLRFDVFPLLVWHFTVDAVYTSLILVRSSNPYFVASGAVAAGALLLPLVAAVALAVRHRGFLPDGAISNAAAGSAPHPERGTGPRPVPVLPETPVPLARLAAAAAAATAALALAWVALPRETFGGAVVLRVDRDGAREAADAFLRASGDDPSRYLSVPLTASALPALEDPADSGADLIPYGWSSLAERWLLREGGLPLLERWATSVLPGPVWQVRYVRELDRHRWWVAVDARTGKVVGWKRTFPEDEAGASLSPEVALERSRAALLALGLDPSTLTVVSTKAEDRKGRRDHRIVLESRVDRAGEASRRVTVELAGEKVALVATALKLPEEFVRGREKSTAWTYVAIGWKVLGFGCLVGFAIAELAKAVRRAVVPWGAVLRAAAVLTIPAALKQASSLPLVLQQYPPEFALATFAVMAATGVLIGLSLPFGLAVVACTFAEAARPGVLGTFGARGRSPGNALRAAAVAVLLVLSFRALRGNVVAWFPAEYGIDGFRFPPGVETLLPAFDVLASATRLLLLLGGGAALLSLLRRGLLEPVAGRVVTALLAVGIYAPLGARSLGDVLVPVLGASLPTAALVASVVLLMRDDPWAYVFTAVGLTLLRGGVELATSGVSPWIVNGGALLALGTLVLLVPGWRQGPRETGTG